MNQPFRELARFFESVHYLHLVPQLVREPERVVWHPNAPYGSDFLEQVASTPQKTRDARLKRILKVLKVAVPQLSAIELWRDHRGAPHRGGAMSTGVLTVHGKPKNSSLMARSD